MAATIARSSVPMNRTTEIILLAELRCSHAARRQEVQPDVIAFLPSFRGDDQTSIGLHADSLQRLPRRPLRRVPRRALPPGAVDAGVKLATVHVLLVGRESVGRASRRVGRA